MKNLTLYSAMICTLIFISPFYIQLFGGPPLINNYPWHFIVPGMIACALFMLHNNYSSKTKKS